MSDKEAYWKSRRSRWKRQKKKIGREQAVLWAEYQAESLSFHKGKFKCQKETEKDTTPENS